MHPAILYPLFFLLVWIVWIPSAILDKKARGDQGHMSILPVIPIFPLAAWGAWAFLNWCGKAMGSGNDWGTLAIGGFHAILLIWFIVTAILSARKLRRRNPD